MSRYLEQKKIEKKRKNDIFVGEEVAYYQTFLSGWIQNRMEQGRQHLAISILGLGYLGINLSGQQNILVFLIWIAANVCFLATVIIMLFTFPKNADYIEELLKGEVGQENLKATNKTLERYTWWMKISTFLGIVLAIFLVLWESFGTVVESFENQKQGGSIMTKEDKFKPTGGQKPSGMQDKLPVNEDASKGGKRERGMEGGEHLKPKPPKKD